MNFSLLVCVFGFRIDTIKVLFGDFFSGFI